MQLTDEHIDDILVVKASGRIDSSTSQTLEQHLMPHLEKDGTSLVIDLAGVDYMSSAGLRVLLLAAKKIRQHQGQLAICSLQDTIREIFEVSGFMAILSVHPSREAALTSLAH